MKWRIVLTVLFVLMLFAGFAYLYVNTFVRKHQKAVILFVADGLDLNTLHLARHQLGRSPAHGEPDDPSIGDARRRSSYRSEVLNLDSFWNIALMSIQTPGQPVPDEGADATALACGQRVANGLVAVNARNEALRSLIYMAQKAQRATGLVTDSSFVQPTPVAFYSTINQKPDPYRNANDLLYSGIDVILGGGDRYFLPASATNEWGRRDGRNLIDEAGKKGYTVVTTRDDLRSVSTWGTSLFGLFASDQFYYTALRPPNPRQPSLAEMTRVAISCLNHKINSYFLVVEDGLIARAGEQNMGKLAVNQVSELDEAIQAAVSYAGPDALILVTNSYSLGSVEPLPPGGDLAAPTPTVDADGKPVKSLTIPLAPPPPPAWVAGPGGPTVTRTQAEWLHQRYVDGGFGSDPSGLLNPEPALRFQTQAQPLAEPAWLATRGEGSTQFRGFISNTDLFDLISEQF